MSKGGKQGIHGPMAGLYDLFVDWPGRLGRELPGIEARLAACGARRVLDLGCGTGRHVEALLRAGYDAHGADVSTDMLAQAAELLGGDERLHRWRLGDAPPDSLERLAPFDAALCLGNVWPMLTDATDLARGAAALRSLVRPGGLVLVALKAFAVRRERGDPYLPLLRRVRDGRAYWFVRFVDFEVPPAPGGAALCDLHMAVLAGDAAAEAVEALHHGATRVRAWSPDELGAWFQAQGFHAVRTCGRLDDPQAAPTGEDLVLEARVADGPGPGRAGQR